MITAETSCHYNSILNDPDRHKVDPFTVYQDYGAADSARTVTTEIHKQAIVYLNKHFPSGS